MGGGGTYFRPRFISVWKAKAGTSEAIKIANDVSLDKERNCGFDMRFIVFNPAEGGKCRGVPRKASFCPEKGVGWLALNLLFAMY